MRAYSEDKFEFWLRKMSVCDWQGPRRMVGVRREGRDKHSLLTRRALDTRKLESFVSLGFSGYMFAAERR